MKSIHTESILPPLSRISVQSFITLRSCNVVELPDMKPFYCFLINNLFLSLVRSVAFCVHCMSFHPVSFGHYIVCLSSMYCLWLPF
jgi:hypothetical protein